MHRNRYGKMSKSDELALKEVARLLSMSSEERESHGVYASNTDLSQIRKALKQNIRKPLAWRWISDITEQKSNLYSLLQAVNKERE